MLSSQKIKLILQCGWAREIFTPDGIRSNSPDYRGIRLYVKQLIFYRMAYQKKLVTQYLLS